MPQIEQPNAQFDAPAVEKAVRDLLIAIGENPDRPGLVETPARVARAYTEIFSGLGADPAQALSARFSEGISDFILVRDIPFYSMCEHHLLPFYGTAQVGYYPPKSGEVAGLSKLARLVEVVARRPQLQEKLTSDIADCLFADFGARGVIVQVEAEHLCMNMRGVKKPGSKTQTLATRGLFAQMPRREIMAYLQEN